MAIRQTADFDGRTLHVDVETDGRVRVEGAERPFDVQPLGASEFLVSDGETRWRVWVADSAGGRHVFVDGQVAEVGLAREGDRPRAPRAPRAPRGESAVAPMPATVIEILVETGQDVRQGDVLLKLEAMKMELPLRAPHDGRVVAVKCRPGDLVQPGTLLVEIGV